MDWSSWITAAATLVLAILTFVYVRLTKKIIEAQTDPCVILSVMLAEDGSTRIQLVARNIGTGIAHDVRFNFSRPIPSKAYGISEDSAEPAEEMNKGPLIDGIPALGPGESRKIYWGQYGGLKRR